MSTTPQLILICGLPATGRSSVAEGLARRMRWSVLADAWVRATLRATTGVYGGDQTERTTGAVVASLARHQLGLGLTIIVDTAAGTRHARDAWRKLAEETGARLVAIECVCSDPALHRQRVDALPAGSEAWPATTWNDVERARSSHEAWSGEHVTLDAVDPLESNVEAAVRAAADSGTAKLM